MDKNYFAVSLTQKHFEWHNEDAWSASEKMPIFAVADGVTMSPTDELAFPNGSKLAAGAFCRESMEVLEKGFDRLNRETIAAAYARANEEIKKVNAEYSANFSTVASLAAVKDGKIYGSRLTDCGLGLVRNGEVIFKTPEFWSFQNERGRRGYGVLNGAMDVSEYIDHYEIPCELGDFLLLWSDGFENHFGIAEFISLFAPFDLDSLRDDILKLDEKLVAQDNEKFGHERTLLVVKL